MITDQLAQVIHGAVLGIDDQGYDEARGVWNARFESRPDLIVLANRADDVSAAIRFARHEGLDLAVKGGGHSYAGHAAMRGGILVDLSSMNDTEIDAERRTARVGAGATWGDFDKQAQLHGLATTGATVSGTGVAGVTLGGGTGYLVRKHGLAADNLLSATVVTADGDVVFASEEEHSDLFWGLRGGGGNFGVVTELEFRLHEIGPEVLAGQMVYPIDAAKDALRFYRDFMQEAPEELQCYAFFLRVPPIPEFPEESHGQLALDLVLCYLGDPEEGQELIRPLQELGRPILSFVAVQPYTSVQTTFDEGLPRARYFTRAHYVEQISDAAIAVIMEHVEGMVGAFTSFYFEPLMGAPGRVPISATAFPERDALYSFHILAGWTDLRQDHAVMAWTRSFHEAMAPHAKGGAYVNLLGEDEHERVERVYGENHRRLVELKREWDPDNVFRRNYNIEPGA